MTQKQQTAMDTIITKLPSESQEAYRNIGEYAVSLGYKPVLKGAKQQYVIFNKSFPNKTSRTILKIVAEVEKTPVYYAMEVRFFANTPPYPPKFQQAIDSYDKTGWMVECNNCDHCKQSQVYYVQSNDGYRKSAGCISLIHMSSLSAEDVPDIKEALKKVDSFYSEFLADPVLKNNDYYAGLNQNV